MNHLICQVKKYRNTHWFNIWCYVVLEISVSEISNGTQLVGKCSRYDSQATDTGKQEMYLLWCTLFHFIHNHLSSNPNFYNDGGNLANCGIHGPFHCDLKEKFNKFKD